LSPSSAPVVAPAPPTTAPAVRARTVRIGSTSKHGLPWYFFLGGVGVLGLIAVSGMTLGEWGEPVLARQGSVLRALERRAEGGE